MTVHEHDDLAYAWLLRDPRVAPCSVPLRDRAVPHRRPQGGVDRVGIALLVGLGIDVLTLATLSFLRGTVQQT